MENVELLIIGLRESQSCFFGEREDVVVSISLPAFLSLRYAFSTSLKTKNQNSLT